MISELPMYARFAWGLRSFLREKMTLEEAEAVVRRRLLEREANFLRLVEKGIFGYPRSPYLHLLKHAQVGLHEIRSMVRAKGLEETLRSLRQSGVYVTFEEFKGRRPIERDGMVLRVRPNDFDNPYLKHHYYTESGGTTGAGMRVIHDLDHLSDRAPYFALAANAHGVYAAPVAIWCGILPNGAGVNQILCQARIGNVPQKWFSPITSQNLRPAMKYRLATQFMVVMGRFFGEAIPQPEAVPLENAIVVARWAAKTARDRGACLIRVSVSFAVRVSLAAQEAGLDLKGAIFMAGGEPPTMAKVRQITRSGAGWAPTYFFSEAGAVGWGCARPRDDNDIHFFKDSLALIQHPRRIPQSNVTVDAFHFTTLLPTAPKLMLNVESDDFGTVEKRECGCSLEQCGFTEHIRNIRSFRKLTGEGVTLVGSEMVEILESVLPERFGGSPLDYQLVEEEDERGFTRLSLRVSPKVAIADENELVELVLKSLGQGSVAADLTREIWRQAGTLQVQRAEPILTDRGKHLPLQRA